MTDTAIATLIPRLGVRAACDAVGATRAGFYRRHWAGRAPPAVPTPRRERSQPRALCAQERQVILEVLHSDRFVDLAQAELWAILRDDGVHLGSQSHLCVILDSYSRDVVGWMLVTRESAALSVGPLRGAAQFRNVPRVDLVRPGGGRSTTTAARR